MKKAGISKTYNFREVESRWYDLWESQGYFQPSPESSRPPFVIVMPPPNVTGSLHMGHMLNDTVHDVVVRRKRMQGYRTLWLPGTDHAGIATQNVVERQLREEGLTRFDLGREKFVERVWKWKEEYGGIITRQIRRIGASCDWSRERFTLDRGLSRAVREVFVRLHEEGLIYRGKRLINWCPRCRTALSDLEVKYEPADAKLYYVRYPARDGAGFIEVATTRPETMLGDTAVAVHPADERYAELRGRIVVLPLIGRELPVIEDDAVDPRFGTGAVKVTPAHDPADFEMGQRHGLDAISVIDEDGRISEQGGPYHGMDRTVARSRIIEDLKNHHLLRKEEPLVHNVGRCERCRIVVEPLLSIQWFVRAEPLAREAIRAVEGDRTRFLPAGWSKTYFEWMYNIRDWCISRQLWWGHRIPAWYCGDCNEVTVSRTDVTQCAKCSSTNVRQDEDVLDTWFSSALWPFSTLGWPDDTGDLRAFYPGSLLITGYEIIFFWVARMIMMGLRFMGEVPFEKVYITGIVRDPEHQKMSKSKGNVVDPLDICDRFGTDAVRFALARMAAPGTDIVYSEEQLEGYRAFSTKIWNAGRFVFRNLEESDRVPSHSEVKKMDRLLAERWILSRLARVTDEVNQSLDRYFLHEAGRTIYQFFWHEFCDWYLEMVKIHPERSKPVLLHTFDTALRLLHPFMPFITEELWSGMPHSGKSIVVAPYPEYDPEMLDPAAEAETRVIQEIISQVRNIRAEMNIDAGLEMRLRVATTDSRIRELLDQDREYIFKLARVGQLEILPRLSGDRLAAQAVGAGIALEVPLGGLIDVVAERMRLSRKLEKIRKEIEELERRLSGAAFIERAPPKVVEENRRRLDAYRDESSKLQAGLRRLE